MSQSHHLPSSLFTVINDSMHSVVGKILGEVNSISRYRKLLANMFPSWAWLASICTSRGNGLSCISINSAAA